MRVFATEIDDQTYRTSSGKVVFLVVDTPAFGRVFLKPEDITEAEDDVANHGWNLTVDDAMFAFRRGVGPDPTAVGMI